MSNTVKNTGIILRLLIDEKKKKVVFAEAGKDFVDILFNFVTLPMGTIVRLMEKHRKSEAITIGCFNNIYASLANIGIEHFRTEACKQMLLYPRSLNQEKCQNLKLKIDDCEATKCYVCSYCPYHGKDRQHYSNFNTLICSRCGGLMKYVIEIDEKEGQISGGNDFTSFIITDDLKVRVVSFGMTCNVLKDLGYAGFDNLVERTHIVSPKEVLILLESLFTSDAPLTNTFLEKNSSYGIKGIQKMLSPAFCGDRKKLNDYQTITVHVYAAKKEGNILKVECGEDFVDLLFTFLAMPLESLFETSGNGINFGCIGNLCRSFKNLVAYNGRETKCVLPYYYYCRKQLLDVITPHKPPTYYRYVSDYRGYSKVFRHTENSCKKPVYPDDKLVPVVWMDPKSDSESNTADESIIPTGGFLKRGLKFMVTDNLCITLSNLSTTIALFKEKQIQFDDVKVEEIIIRKEEALKLLEASLLTSSALSTAILARKSASTSEPKKSVSIKVKTET